MHPERMPNPDRQRRDRFSVCILPTGRNFKNADCKSIRFALPAPRPLGPSS